MSATPDSAPFSALCSLALRAKNEEAGAENALLTRLYAQVPGTVRSQLSRRGHTLDEHAREDVVQEVVLAVIQRDLPRFVPEMGTFATLIRFRVRWCIADALRRACRRSAHEWLVSDEEELSEARAPLIDQPDERIAHARAELQLLVLRDEVEAALADVPAARDAVVRHDFDGLRLQDIAAEMSVHTSNACRQRKKGLRLLAERLPAALRDAA